MLHCLLSPSVGYRLQILHDNESSHPLERGCAGDAMLLLVFFDLTRRGGKVDLLGEAIVCLTEAWDLVRHVLCQLDVSKSGFNPRKSPSVISFGECHIDQCCDRPGGRTKTTTFVSEGYVSTMEQLVGKKVGPGPGTYQ